MIINFKTSLSFKLTKLTKFSYELNNFQIRKFWDSLTLNENIEKLVEKKIKLYLEKVYLAR